MCSQDRDKPEAVSTLYPVFLVASWPIYDDEGDVISADSIILETYQTPAQLAQRWGLAYNDGLADIEAQLFLYGNLLVSNDPEVNGGATWSLVTHDYVV